MTAIWQNDESGWHLLSPTGFPNEATLHTLVEQAPHLHPLASTPRLVVLGKEVQHGIAYLQFWRSVFERRAPKSLFRIEQSITPIKQGNSTREMSNELLNALTGAYKKADRRPIDIE